LPAVTTQAVQRPGAVPGDRDAAGARAHHDAGAITERCDQRDLDVGGDHDERGDALAAERRVQLVALGRPPGARRADDENVGGTVSCLGKRTAHQLGDGASRGERPSRAQGRAGSGGSREHGAAGAIRHCDGRLGPSDVSACNHGHAIVTLLAYGVAPMPALHQP
jgi:hypothetical protein